MKRKILILCAAALILLTACSTAGTSSGTSQAPVSSKAEVTKLPEVPALGEDLILMNEQFKDYDRYFNEMHNLREYPEAVGLYEVKDGAIYLSANYLGISSTNGQPKDILFYDGHKIGACLFTDSVIFFAEENGTDLYQLNTNTREVRQLYHGDRVIDEILGDDRCVLFCCTDGWLYRTYVLTGETREIFQVPMREMASFVMWTTNQVEICYLVGEDVLKTLPEKMSRCRVGYVDEDNKVGAAFMLDCNTKTLRGMDADEYYGRRAYLGGL